MAAASNMGILNPFVFNQFGTYGFAAAQVSHLNPLQQYHDFLTNRQSSDSNQSLDYSQLIQQQQQQQAALVAANNSPAAANLAANLGSYLSPAALATGLPTAGLNGLTSGVVTSTTGKLKSSIILWS